MITCINDLIEMQRGTENYDRLKKEWDDLWDRIAWLDAIEGAGVDNWEGMDEARNIYNGGGE